MTNRRTRILHMAVASLAIAGGLTAGSRAVLGASSPTTERAASAGFATAPIDPI